MSKKILPSVLIIDDEADIRTSSKMVLEKDFTVYEADCGENALKMLSQKNIDLVICDIRMPGLDGLQILQKIKHDAPETEVIMQTAITDTKATVKAIKSGAYDYLVKPAEPEQLINICHRALEKKELLNKNRALTAQLEQYQIGKMLGKSKSMQEVFKKIKKIASTDISILITGETGTGKELVAKAIHYEGNKKEKPFIAINCGAIPAELLESELFGYEKGSFTSADSRKIGKFELANGGTIFLDEIGNMPMIMQAKILRVLQEKEVERIGGTKPISIDVRIISATNEDLKKRVQEGKFRSDLYHRLNVIPLELPPLRKRQEDIELLSDHFLKKYSQLYNGNFQTINAETIEYLKSYSWPGNIRELEHLFQRIITLEEGQEILPTHLPLEIITEKPKRGKYTGGGLAEIIGEYEKQIIIRALEDNEHNIQKVADKFKVHRSTLTSKIQNYGLQFETKIRS